MLEHWVAAAMVEGVGTIKLKKLLEQHHSIETVCQLLNAPLDLARQAIVEAEKNGIGILSQEDPDYPLPLKDIYDPPPVLFVLGDLHYDYTKSIAIVGTRKASAYGKLMAKRLSKELAALGFTIVSGLAVGIDTAAHEGALEAKGKTIAVLGCGVDIGYPASNRKLKRAITGAGAVISEFLPGTFPEQWRFPQRNRIISGLSRGVIVVEGHYESGAMITAKLALEQGREVFAVPGNVGSDQSRGPHWLIKQGAKLVETIDDVLEEFNLDLPHKAQVPKLSPENNKVDLSTEETKVLSVLTAEPKHIDAIAAACDLPVSQVASLLLMLEVKQKILSLPGKSYMLAE